MNNSEETPWPISYIGSKIYPHKPKSETNPLNKPTGKYTGRCSKCGSDDLWDDCSAYGCNNCGAIYSQ